MRIPGISHLVEGGTLPNSVLLLTGPVGAGAGELRRAAGPGGEGGGAA